MGRLLILLILSIAYSINTNGQNFVFIGENSYPSTEKYTLKSNSDDEKINDLKIVFAKDGEKALIVVSSKLSDVVKISDKLIIYLDDGTVISCIDRGINDNVDSNAISAYSLTKAELTKIKSSNINTIRYQIVCPVCGPINLWEGAYSASNVGSLKIDFSKVVTEFYDY
jgi:superfamily II helicase